MPSVIYVAIGLPGFIRCPVDANPPVTLVKWKKDGLPLRIDKVSLCTLAVISLRLETSAAYLWFTASFSLFSSSVPLYFSHFKMWGVVVFCWPEQHINSSLLYTLPMTPPPTVPWLEPNGGWEHPCGRGDRGLPRHLYLHALQCPGFHGMVHSCSPGAKGTCHSKTSLRRMSTSSIFTFLTQPPPLALCPSGQDPPKFSVVPGGEYRQEAGRELVIPCEAEGDPFPNITWRKVRPPPPPLHHQTFCIKLFYNQRSIPTFMRLPLFF